MMSVGVWDGGVKAVGADYNGTESASPIGRLGQEKQEKEK